MLHSQNIFTVKVAGEVCFYNVRPVMTRVKYMLNNFNVTHSTSYVIQPPLYGVLCFTETSGAAP